MHVEESRGRSKGRTAGEAICKGLVAKADDPAPVAANPPTVIKVVMKILTSGAMARPPEGARPADPAQEPGRQTLAADPQSRKGLWMSFRFLL